MRRRKTRSSLSVVTVLAMLMALLPLAVPAAANPNVFLNEMQVSTTGTDWEFFELQGPAGTDLSDLTLVGIESDAGDSAGTIDRVIGLGGQSIPADGFWVGINGLGASTYGVTGDFTIGDNTFENSTATYFLVTGFTGSAGEDLDADNDGVLDSMPWTAVVDALNIRDSGVDDLDYGAPSVGPDGTFLPSGAYRCPDAPFGGWDANILNFSIPDGTPGTNNCGEPEPEPELIPIHDVQGPGDSSPLVGLAVIIEGVVVGDFQGTATDDQFTGFHVQEQDGEVDADPMTSEGIFVYAPGAVDVAIGDVVTVTGTVAEFFGLTEINEVTSIEVGGSGSVSATPVALPVTSVGEWEKYEGMLVTFPQDLYITEFFNFDRFGEVVLATSRQFQATQIELPGSPEAAAITAANALARISLDDGQGGQYPVFTRHPAGGEFTLEHRFRGGDIIRNLIGVVDFAFGNYKIQPTQGADYDAINPRADAPDVGPASIKVASFNVLNLFTHLDDGVNDICGPTGLDECRGADTAEEYERQLTKIVAGIIGTGADVLGLQEIENDIRDDEPVYPNRAHDPVLALVEALNAIEGDETWAWAGEASYYNDYPVRNEIIYRTASVTPIGTPVALEDPAFDDPASGDDPVGRPPLAQTFADGNGEVFTVVTNHFKSKGSSCGSLGDPDTGDGSGNCNLTRVAQSEALLNFVAELQASTHDNDVLIIGDLNSYAKEAPISALEDGGYTNLLALYDGPWEYTYVFDGQLGNLDHALGSASILLQVTGTAAWHINSDEPDILDYDTSIKKDPQDALYEPNAFRASDHDPVIVGLDLTAASDFVVEVEPNKLWSPNHKYREVDVFGRDDVGDLWINVLDAISSEMDCCYDRYDLPNDIVITSATTVDLRAERYTEVYGRTYTITAYAWDGPGNALLTDLYVLVPHDQRDKKASKN
jgi:hypothetical protein